MTIARVLQERIDELFQEYDRPASPGCALGVLSGGELIYGRGYGMADLDRRTPITLDTVFHLASVSKQFTATCIALLEEAGELRLEDEAKRYLDFLPDYGCPLEIRHLLYMTNGLEDFYEVTNFILGIPEGNYFSRQEAIRILRAADWLKFPPGEQWAYGNTGYFLLACIIEEVTGRPFAEFAAEQLFRPLGMHGTFFRTDRFADIPGRAAGYVRQIQAAGGITYLPQNELLEFGGAGQAWSSVNDLVRWEGNFLGNRLGKKDPGLIAKLFTPGRLNDGSPTCYACGQFVTRRAGHTVVYHEGGAAGVNTVLYRIPDKRLSVICLANTSDFLTVLLRKLGEECYERVAGIVSPWEPVEAEAPDASTAGEGPVSPAPAPAPAAVGSLAGSYEDPVTSHIWEVTCNEAGVSVLENYAARFSLLFDPPSDPDRLRFHCDPGGQTGCFGRPENGRRMEIRVGEGPAARTFQRYLDQPLAPEVLLEYEGTYTCQPLETGYRVHAASGGVRLENLAPERDFLNVLFTPTVRDMFIARYPPRIGWYVMQFRRDAAGRLSSFVFRDELPGRDRWVFEKE